MPIISFKRVEKKYIVTKEQKEKLISILLEHMEPDGYCRNGKTYRIQNLYLDTFDNASIRRSIEKPKYKQKIRIRKYYSRDEYFLEIKKKYKGIVGKRRISLSENEIYEFIKNNKLPSRESIVEKQIINEINYALKLYNYKPTAFIFYDRLAFFDRNDSQFRITFDDNIKGKRDNFVFDQDDYETEVIDSNHSILEIKTNKNYPLWLVKALGELKIYPHSYSKYGNEYKMRLLIKE